jgi:hypothetical protein
MSKNKSELERQLQKKVNQRQQVQTQLAEVQIHLSQINNDFNERKLGTQDRIKACSNSRPPKFEQAVSWPHVPSNECPTKYAQFFSEKEMLERDLWKEMDYIKGKHLEAIENPKKHENNLQLQENILTQEINGLFTQITKISKNPTQKNNKSQKPCPLSKKTTTNNKSQKPCPLSKKK